LKGDFVAVKIVCALIAIVLFFGYLGPIAWKLKSAALLVVMAVGSVMMLYDLWQSLHED
jgi:hypothetical protein